MASVQDFFSETEKHAIVDAIRKVEMYTTGEIRVHLDEKCEKEAYDRTVELFHLLKMDKTPFRNAVLVFIAVKDKKFAVIGDEALHNKVSKDFWKKVGDKLAEDFSNSRFGNGVLHAIDTIGEMLIKHFPNIDELDRNELPDDISFS